MLDRNIGLRQLQAFRTLAATLNFTEAAAELGVSQPTLSRSVHRLEEELGVRLLERSTRHVALTEEGARLRNELADVLPRLEAALAPAGARTLRLGFTWLLPGDWLHEAIERFERDTGTAVELSRRDELHAGVTQRSVDVALLRTKEVPRGLRALELGREHQVAAVARTSPLARLSTLEWTELARHPIVANTVSGTVRGECWPAGHRPATVVNCRNFDEWLELIAAGKGIGVGPALLSRRRPHPAVDFVPLTGVDPVPLRLVRPLQGAHPHAERLMLLAREVLTEHRARRETAQPPPPASETAPEPASPAV
ncbi:LysR family transcriptional regulator [Streptomyces iconiensis]|uniref:LysR family transcriptional regulator n=1 Tax=Streptomyces iconiensis TaxID=1384038 RepID=A0ABT6ZN36_9ACTN|nr:LysR family transcriptional regulator [Streptomyces iconiensis]MDJ1130472.1 LysR family transcriptional regulator [Streptomyces iconiensis]